MPRRRGDLRLPAGNLEGAERRDLPECDLRLSVDPSRRSPMGAPRPACASAPRSSESSGSRPACGADPIRGRGHPLRVQPFSLCESGLHGRARMVGLRRRQRPRRPVPTACLPGPAACHAELSDCLSPVQCRPNPTCRPGSPPACRPNSSDCPNLLGYSDPPSRQGLPSRSGLTNRQGPSGRQGLPSRPEAGPRSPAGRRSGRSGR